MHLNPYGADAVLLAVNLVGLNIEWTRMRREATDIRLSILQTFRSVYPNETPLYPAEQMRRNIASARLNNHGLEAGWGAARPDRRDRKVDDAPTIF